MRLTRIASVLAAAAMAWSAAAATASQSPRDNKTTKQVALTVEGMTCGGCEASVKMAAKKVDGVVDAKVSYQKGIAEITYDAGKTTPEAIAKAITEHSGFRASAPKTGTKG